MTKILGKLIEAYRIWNFQREQLAVRRKAKLAASLEYGEASRHFFPLLKAKFVDSETWAIAADWFRANANHHCVHNVSEMLNGQGGYLAQKWLNTRAAASDSKGIDIGPVVRRIGNSTIPGIDHFMSLRVEEAAFAAKLADAASDDAVWVLVKAGTMEVVKALQEKMSNISYGNWFQCVRMASAMSAISGSGRHPNHEYWKSNPKAASMIFHKPDAALALLTGRFPEGCADEARKRALTELVNRGIAELEQAASASPSAAAKLFLLERLSDWRNETLSAAVALVVRNSVTIFEPLFRLTWARQQVDQKLTEYLAQREAASAEVARLDLEYAKVEYNWKHGAISDEEKDRILNPPQPPPRGGDPKPRS